MNEDNLLRAHMTISLDQATHSFLVELADSADVTVSDEVRAAVEEFLARPLTTRAHRLAEKRQRLAALKPQHVPVSGVTYPYDPAERGRNSRLGFKRCSIAMSDALRDAVRERARAEGVTYAELVRTAITFHLSEQIAGRQGIASAASAAPFSEKTVVGIGA